MKRQLGMLRAEKGQTLVWVAIGLVALIGMLGLAIDVGSLYGERRQMQNAADAAALEAARARCFDELGADASAQKGEDFAAANYVRPRAAYQEFVVAPRDGNSWEFSATAIEDVPLYFARIFGFAPTRVQAQAAAACGASPVTCGLFPIAFDKPTWDDIKDQCGQKFYVWTSEYDKVTGNCDQTPNCDICDCTKVYQKKQDIPANPEPGVIAISDAGRAWLDFTSSVTSLNPDGCAEQNGCGTNELKCWVATPSAVVVFKNDCVSGTNGVKGGVRVEVNKRVGDYVNLPIFDGTCTPPTPGPGTPEPANNDCKGGFKIVDFGCMGVVKWENQPVLLGWKATPTPPPAPTPSPTPGGCGANGNSEPEVCWKGQLMPVTVGCDECATDCGMAYQGGDPGSGIKSISLIPVTP